MRRQSIMDMTTKRKIFETVKLHLLTQKSKCIDSVGSCKYRMHHPTKTLKCAIGALIPDSQYNPDMDNPEYSTGLYDTFYQEYLEVRGNTLVKEVLCGIYGELDLEFLTQLQKIHDCTKAEDWERVLDNFEQIELGEV